LGCTQICNAEVLRGFRRSSGQHAPGNQDLPHVLYLTMTGAERGAPLEAMWWTSALSTVAQRSRSCWRWSYSSPLVKAYGSGALEPGTSNADTEFGI